MEDITVDVPLMALGRAIGATSSTWLMNRVMRGEIPAFKRDGRWVVSKADYDRLVAEHNERGL